MLQVNEIARLANVTADTVRYYVRIGLLKPKRNPSNGYKIFKQDDIKIVKFINQAKNLGFTLDDIKKILSYSKKGKSPCPLVRKIIQQRIEENCQKLTESVTLLNRMKEALALWESMPDGEPNGKSICHLIEQSMIDFNER